MILPEFVGGSGDDEAVAAALAFNLELNCKWVAACSLSGQLMPQFCSDCLRS